MVQITLIYTTHMLDRRNAASSVARTGLNRVSFQAIFGMPGISEGPMIFVDVASPSIGIHVK